MTAAGTANAIRTPVLVSTAPLPPGSSSRHGNHPYQFFCRLTPSVLLLLVFWKLLLLRVTPMPAIHSFPACG